MTEIEYSPTFVCTPPRFTGCSHSLMLMNFMSLGSRGMRPSASSSGQPQSQAMISGSGLTRRTPSRKVVSSSPMVSQEVRFVQRGQSPALGARLPQPPPWEKQLVWFSDMLMEKKPPISGTCRTTCSSEPAIHSRTSGTLVHSAFSPWSEAPFMPGRFSKNAGGMARGSFR